VLEVKLPTASGTVIGKKTVSDKELAKNDAYFQLGDDYYGLTRDKDDGKALEKDLSSEIPFSFKMSDGKVELSQKLTSDTSNPSTFRKASETSLEKPITVATGKTTVGGITGFFVNNSTKLVTFDDGDVMSYTGRANFPSYPFEEGTVFYVHTGTTLNNILVIGESAEEIKADGYAVWTGSTRNSADGPQHQLFVNGVLGWYVIDENVPVTADAKTTIFEFFYNESDKTVKLGDLGEDDVEEYEIQTVDDGYFISVKGEAVEYADDVVFYNISNTNVSNWAKVAESALKKGQNVKCVMSDDGVLAVFIVP